MNKKLKMHRIIIHLLAAEIIIREIDIFENKRFDSNEITNN